MKMRLVYSFLLFWGLQTICAGQLNLSVSYSSGFSQPATHESIIQQFNSDRSWLQSSFKEMRWLNGYGFGLRYKFDRIAFDAKWENQVDRLNANGKDPNNADAAFEQTLYFKLSTYSFGVESFFSEKFSIHANFEFNKVRYRTEVTDINDKFELMSDWGTGSTFSLGYNFIGGGLMHVSLRPYIHLSWSNHDLTELDNALNPDVNSIADLDEEFLNFGIKLIFYNGQW